MTPEELNAFLEQIGALGAVPDEQGLLMRQANQGQALMNTPSAAGQNVGGTYRASSPLEHLSVALQRVMGAKQQQGAEDAFRQTLDTQTKGRVASTKMDYANQEKQRRQIQALIDAMNPTTEMPTMDLRPPQVTEMPTMDLRPQVTEMPVMDLRALLAGR
jgi:hypothetical protein